MSTWTPGVIRAQLPTGTTHFPGWISEPFGLDWGIETISGKVMWIVHHLPSGWNLFAVDHHIEDVMRLVDLLRSMGDWSGTDPHLIMKEFEDTISVVRQSGFIVHKASTVGRPTYPDQVGVPA